MVLVHNIWRFHIKYNQWWSRIPSAPRPRGYVSQEPSTRHTNQVQRRHYPADIITLTDHITSHKKIEYLLNNQEITDSIIE